MDSIEDKQALLRKEVLQRGIDPEEFVEYLGDLKNQGDNVDLENWSLAELEEAIKKFKVNHQSPVKSQLRNSRNLYNTKKSKIVDSIKKERIVYDESSNLWDQQMAQQRDCAKSELKFKIPQQDEFRIIIQKAEIKSVGGFIFGIGSRNQLNLTISTNFTNNKVTRKGEDVDWLRNILINNYPGYFVPPLQPEREINSDDYKGIEKRKNQIEAFLNKLISFKAFHHSRHVYSFFEEYNPKKFTQFKEKQASFDTNRDVQYVQSATGKFRVEISNEIIKIMKGSSQIGQEMASLYGQLSKCCQKLVSYMEKTDKYVKQLSIISNKLSDKYMQSQKLLKMEDLKLSTIFLSFSSIANNSSKNLRRHIKAFYQFYEGYVKEVSKDWNEFISNDSKVQKQQKKYLNEKDNLLKKKQKWMNDITRWQLPQAEYLQLKNRDISTMQKDQKFARMFPSQNHNENNVRLWIGHLNQNYKESFRALLGQQQTFLINKFAQYSGEATCLNKELIANFTEFTSMIFV